MYLQYYQHMFNTTWTLVMSFVDTFLIYCTEIEVIMPSNDFKGQMCR